jgi:hypothetical protein
VETGWRSWAGSDSAGLGLRARWNTRSLISWPFVHGIPQSYCYSECCLREFSAGTVQRRIFGLGGVFPVLGSGEPCFDGATSCMGLIRGITRSQH